MVVVFVYDADMPREGDGHGLRTLGNSLATNKGVYCFYQQHDDDVHGLISKMLLSAGRRVVIVGHGAGGSTAIRACCGLWGEGVMIDHLFLLDPVPQGFWGAFNVHGFRLPSNVTDADCYRRQCRLPPWSRKIRKSANHFENHVLYLDHEAIPASPIVQARITACVLATK